MGLNLADDNSIRDLKKTLAAPGSLPAALDYYRFVYGSKDTDPALADVQSAYL